MDWITITGVKPWDGRYELDPESDFTTREWGWIKRFSGYMPLTIDDGFEGADPELIAALAIIALYRADKVTVRDVPDLFERLADAPFPAGIRYEGAGDKTEEAEGNPLPPSSTSSDSTSGPNGKASSANSDVTPAPIGTPGLGSSASLPTGSAN